MGAIIYFNADRRQIKSIWLFVPYDLHPSIRKLTDEKCSAIGNVQILLPNANRLLSDLEARKKQQEKSLNNLEPRIKATSTKKISLFSFLFIFQRLFFFFYSVRVSNFHLLTVDASHLISKRVVTFIQGLQAMSQQKDEEHNEREANIMPEIVAGSWILACQRNCINEKRKRQCYIIINSIFGKK